MRITISVVAAMAFCCCTGGPVTAQETLPATPAPKLVLSHPSWDFGEVWHPESRTLPLVIRNEGNAALKITKVHSSCGCTVVQPARYELGPGESTEATVVYNTEGKQGNVSSTVTIESNDPQRPQVMFNVKGHVKRAVTKEPLGGLVIRTLETKPGQSGTVKLQNHTDKPMSLKLVSKDLKDFEIEIREVTPGMLYEIVGWNTAELRPGPTSGTLVFSTGLEREDRVSVGVKIRVLALADVNPPCIYMEPGTATKPEAREVSIHYYGTRDDFKITEAKCTNPDVKVKIQRVEPPMHGMEKLTPKIKAIARLSVETPAANALPPGGALVEIFTNDPACPKVECPVTTDSRVWRLKAYGIVEGPPQTTGK